MPELPEVETVKNALKRQIHHRTIIGCEVLYPPIIETPDIKTLEKQIVGQTICDMKRRGKWLLFELDHYVLFSHLRMEGKYFLRKEHDPSLKHIHVIFHLDDGRSLLYQDTRKFGRMHLIKKEEIEKQKPLIELGLEPFDSNLTSSYLKEKYQKKSLPIKSVLLDQSIVTGIGNIYADEILFLAKINPLKKAKDLTDKERTRIIEVTKEVLQKAIDQGGTTIRSYTSSEGVHGRFQQSLFVHSKEGDPCPSCGTAITRIKVNGRSTYFCKKCQKLSNNFKKGIE